MNGRTRSHRVLAVGLMGMLAVTFGREGMSFGAASPAGFGRVPPPLTCSRSSIAKR